MKSGARVRFLHLREAPFRSFRVMAASLSWRGMGSPRDRRSFGYGLLIAEPPREFKAKVRRRSEPAGQVIGRLGRKIGVGDAGPAADADPEIVGVDEVHP